MSGATREEISKALLDFLVMNFPRARQNGVSVDDSLLEQRVIDSLGLFELMTYIEAEFEIRVDDADATEENFGSVAAVTEYVLRARGG